MATQKLNGLLLTAANDAAILEPNPQWDRPVNSMLGDFFQHQRPWIQPRWLSYSPTRPLLYALALKQAAPRKLI